MCIRDRLCAPLLYHDARARIPRTGFAVGVLIVAGVLLMQFGNAHGALAPSAWLALACVPVSYTHLDVYKRQGCLRAGSARRSSGCAVVRVVAGGAVGIACGRHATGACAGACNAVRHAQVCSCLLYTSRCV